MKKIITVILIFFLLAITFTGWKLFGPTLSNSPGDFFYIKTGETFQGVKDSLIARKYISGDWWFSKASRIVGFDATRVKAGKYRIKKGMSLFNLVRMLNNGQQTPVNLVITKLRTKEDFSKKAGNMFECDSSQIIGFLNNPDSLRQFGLDSNTVITAVIPDTYTYFWNTTPRKIFQKLYDHSQKFWTEERRKKAADHSLSPAQAYTLASIIEEETNAKSDKPNIASVYLNRIEKGMPLQADPTIKFALRDFGIKRIYEKYFSIESPYNTYRNKGLPPGPICTPSPESIDEVLNSPKTDYLYFVADATHPGTHLFSTSYAEHLKNARQYHQFLDKSDSLNKAK